MTSDVFGRLRTSSGINGKDHVIFKNPSTPGIKVSRLYLRKSWQVSSSVSDMNLSNAKLGNCVRDMDAWMLSNKLKLNKDKSEVLVISSSYRLRPPLSSIDICDETVSCSPSARNIGVIFDQSLCMVPHANAVCQSCFFHLRNIGFIRKYRTYDAAKIIIHAFVVSKLDYCNSLLYGLPSYLIQKLQHVQNSAARLVN